MMIYKSAYGWCSLATVMISIFVLAGCQGFLDIKVSNLDTLQPHFEFYNAYDKRVTVELITFTIYRKDANNTEVVVWAIESRNARLTSTSDSQNSLIASVQYGIAPDGFTTIKEPELLQFGKKYYVNSYLKVAADESIVGGQGEFSPTK